jgi:uncharacterized coiled-coil DUF342 family protein
MVDKVINVFKNDPTADKFRQRATEILGVFSKAKEELVKLNSDQSEYLGVVTDKISELHKEKTSVQNSINENNRVITKIGEFLVK